MKGTSSLFKALEFQRRVTVAWLIGTWVSLLLAGDGLAAVSSQTRTDIRVGPSALGDLSFPQFDPASGQLERVTATVDPGSQINATAQGTNTGEAPDLVSARLRATFLISDELIQMRSMVDGSTTFQAPAQSPASSSFTTSGSGASQEATDTATLQAWTGLGSRTLRWELTDLAGTFDSMTTQGDVEIDTVTVSVTVTFTYSETVVPPVSIIYDRADGTFHYVEGDRAVVIEFNPQLTDPGAWAVRYESTTNAPGTLIKLPLTGESGFYRLRYRDKPAGSRVPTRDTHPVSH